MKKTRMQIIVDLARNELMDYYFDYPAPEDVTDDMDLLEERTIDRVQPMSDKEVLEAITKLYEAGLIGPE
jgi:hypothetical protein